MERDAERITMKTALIPLAFATLLSASSTFAQNAADAWRGTLTSAYQVKGASDKGNGRTEAYACFDSGAKPEWERCQLVAIANRDTPTGMDYYTPRTSRLMAYGTSTFLRSEIAVLDCKKPLYVLYPYLVSKQRQFLLKAVSVMLNGKVVLQRPIQSQNVLQRSESYGHEEKAHFIADGEQIAALRKIAQGGKVSIRFTGEAGSMSVNPQDATMFSRDVTDALAIYDALSAAITPEAQQACLAEK